MFMDESKRKEIESRLGANFTWYLANQGELLKSYAGKELLIVNCAVVGAYDELIDAYVEGAKKYGFGNFSLQKCSPGDPTSHLLNMPHFRVAA
jgi:hypothetical protein